MNVFPRRADPNLPMDAVYAPERDLAHVVPNVANVWLPEAIKSENVVTWIRAYMEQTGTTLVDMQKGVEALQASLAAMEDPGPDSAEHPMRVAMKEGGFWALPDPVKVATLTMTALPILAYYANYAWFAHQGAKPSRIVVASGAMRDALEAGIEVQRKDPWLGRLLRSRKGGR